MGDLQHLCQAGYQALVLDDAVRLERHQTLGEGLSHEDLRVVEYRLLELRAEAALSQRLVEHVEHDDRVVHVHLELGSLRVLQIEVAFDVVFYRARLLISTDVVKVGVIQLLVVHLNRCRDSVSLDRPGVLRKYLLQKIVVEEDGCRRVAIDVDVLQIENDLWTEIVNVVPELIQWLLRVERRLVEVQLQQSFVLVVRVGSRGLAWAATAGELLPIVLVGLLLDGLALQAEVRALHALLVPDLGRRSRRHPVLWTSSFGRGADPRTRGALSLALR